MPAFITRRTQAQGANNRAGQKQQTTNRGAAMKTTKYGIALMICREASEISSSALRISGRTVIGWENQRVLQW
jgi:hypothetical protein